MTELSRRSFLGAMLAAASAPAFVKAGVLMPVRQLVVAPSMILWGDGIHDDTLALNSLLTGGAVMFAGKFISQVENKIYLPPGEFRISASIKPTIPAVIESSIFKWAGNNTAPMFNIDTAVDLKINSCAFKGSGFEFQGKPAFEGDCYVPSGKKVLIQHEGIYWEDKND